MRSAPRSAASEASGHGPLVEARGVSFAYAGTPVIEGVDLRIDPGEFVALVGPNGSGKSTLLQVLLGALEPSHGDVRLLGRPAGDVTDRWRVGYVPQRPSLAID